MKLIEKHLCLHCNETFQSRNALFNHLRMIGVPDIKPVPTFWELRESRIRKKQRVALMRRLSKMKI
jgi:hypothetical protein